jgi:hypothetical protein
MSPLDQRQRSFEPFLWPRRPNREQRESPYKIRRFWWRVLGSNQRRQCRRFYRWFLIAVVKPLERRIPGLPAIPLAALSVAVPRMSRAAGPPVAHSGSADLRDVVPLSDSHLHPVHAVRRHGRTRPWQHYLTAGQCRQLVSCSRRSQVPTSRQPGPDRRDRTAVLNTVSLPGDVRAH